MVILRSFVFQFLLITLVLVLSVYSDIYISQPFSFFDLLAICISLPLLFLLVLLQGKLYKQASGNVRTRVFVSVSAFLLSLLLMIAFDTIWFEFRGESFF
jgi:hypothetical protein